MLGFAPALTAEVPAAILHFRDDGAAMVACWGTLTTCDVTLLKGWVGLATTMHTNIGVRAHHLLVVFTKFIYSVLASVAMFESRELLPHTPGQRVSPAAPMA